MPATTHAATRCFPYCRASEGNRIITEFYDRDDVNRSAGRRPFIAQWPTPRPAAFEIMRTVDDDVDAFERWLTAAVEAGPAGDAALTWALANAHQEWQRTMLIAALGETSGADGAEMIRREASNAVAGSDRRCAALVAAAKRLGSDGSDLFAGLLTDPDETVRRYAAQCMACVGDGRAWRTMLDLLDATLSHPSRTHLNPNSLTLQSVTLPVVVYLARHATDQARRALVIGRLRAGWDRLDEAERHWLRFAWPQCDPGFDETDPAAKAPDAAAMASWLATPLLQPLFA